MYQVNTIDGRTILLGDAIYCTSWFLKACACFSWLQSNLFTIKRIVRLNTSNIALFTHSAVILVVEHMYTIEK